MFDLDKKTHAGVQALKADATQAKQLRRRKGLAADQPGENVTPYLYDDHDYREFAQELGLKVCACLFDGLDPAARYPLSAFSPDNHFAHIAFRKFRELSKSDTI